MKNTIPTKVVKQIIADILIERGNKILDDADKMAEQEIKEHGVTSEYVGELETTSCGTYILADDVLYGQISVEEALNVILTPFERKIAKNRCIEWLNKEEPENGKDIEL